MPNRDGAVSDAKQKLPMVHVPMTGGAIVPAYNYPGCEAKMTQTQLADVFLGKITNWSEFGCADKNTPIRLLTVNISEKPKVAIYQSSCLPSSSFTNGRSDRSGTTGKPVCVY